MSCSFVLTFALSGSGRGLGASPLLPLRGAHEAAEQEHHPHGGGDGHHHGLVHACGGRAGCARNTREWRPPYKKNVRKNESDGRNERKDKAHARKGVSKTNKRARRSRSTANRLSYCLFLETNLTPQTTRSTRSSTHESRGRNTLSKSRRTTPNSEHERRLNKGSGASNDHSALAFSLGYWVRRR